MSAVLGITIKTAFLVLASLGIAAALRRRAASVRHSVMATALAGCLCLPLFELALPTWSVSLPAAWVGSTGVASQRWVGELHSRSPWPDSTTDERMRLDNRQESPAPQTLAFVAVAVWFAGALLGVAILADGVLRLRQIASRAEAVEAGAWRARADELSRMYGLRRSVRILVCRHEPLVATWGIWRSTIVVPRGALAWSEERIDVVLRHELAHVRRRDWLVTLIASLLRALYWFNPFLWIAHGRLRDEAERACDDLVLRSGIAGTDYAAHLLDVARETLSGRQAWSSAVAIVHHSRLEGRIRAMLDPRLNRQPVTAFGQFAIVTVLTSATLVLGSVSLSGRTTPPSVPDPQVTSAAATFSSRAMNLVQGASKAPATPARQAATQQERGGVIEGVLYDQFGGLLPGVTVRITAVRSGATNATATDRSGAFAFRGLSDDDYEVITELPGFTTVRNVIRAEAGSTVRRHIVLPIGTFSETISVTCSPAVASSARPTAPTSADTPGVARRRALGDWKIEPTVPAIFTGGIGGQIRVPHKLVDSRPQCPTNVSARPPRVQLAGRIGIDGVLTDLRDISEQVDQAYLAAAMEAVREWRFSPTQLNGAPIEVNITITVDYLQ